MPSRHQRKAWTMVLLLLALPFNNAFLFGSLGGGGGGGGSCNSWFVFYSKPFEKFF